MTSEAAIQEQLINYLDLVLPDGSLRHHSPNEGMHKPHYRAKQARLGMTSGWPDVEIYCPASFFRKGKPPASIFIEMKSATGRVSDKQQLVLEKLDALGCYTQVCKSMEEAVDFLRGILKL